MSNSTATLAGIVTHKGELAALRALLREGLTLHLYAGVDVKLTPNLTRSAFREASFPGYAPEELDEGSWRIEAGPPSRALGTPRTFTRTAGGAAEDIYGFFLCTRDGEVYGAYRFADAPWDLRREHDAAKVIPFLYSPSSPPG